ncbi:MAG: ribonuclease III [Pseudomonadales bacterium]
MSELQATRLESRLGYRFADPGLLEQALTHKSFARDHNERLEFLGDAVLGYVVAQRLFEARPGAAEDELTLLRASLVRRETLAELATELDVGSFLRLGVGERRSGGHKRKSILADALEALIGAVHLDGGIEAARALVLALLEPRLQALDPETLKDSKTRLQELLQGRNLPLPEYAIVATSGAAHARVFTVSCRVGALHLEVTADGRSRRAAEKAAALRMLDEVALHG